MHCAYRIANGRVIDPAAGVDAIKDIYIRNSRIVAPEGAMTADETIDATGCLVLPGLIDFHTHLDRGHGDHGIHGDVICLPSGVTAAVDMGSTGTAGFEGFYRDVVCGLELTVKSFVNVSPIGVTTIRHFENPDPAVWDIARLEYMFERYGDQLLGLKVRVGKAPSGRFGLEGLKAARALADRLGVRLAAHVVEPEHPYSDILPLLGPGDVLCHCFQGQGAYAVAGAQGVTAAAREARERGVIFDVASARGNYSFAVQRAAVDAGFYPDVISSDIVAQSAYGRKLFSLPYVMSGFLAAGMPLAEVIRATTATPAAQMGLAGHIGTLAPGALGDVAICRVRESLITFNDPYGNSLTGGQLLVPQATFKAGRCLFMRIDFAF